MPEVAGSGGLIFEKQEMWRGDRLQDSEWFEELRTDAAQAHDRNKSFGFAEYTPQKGT